MDEQEILAEEAAEEVTQKVTDGVTQKVTDEVTAKVTDGVTDDFFAWQCRIRQDATRQADGRPSPGMYARLLEPEDCNAASIVFLLQRKDAQQYVAQFRFIVASSFEPQERRERGLKVLASTYYQNSPMFLPLITATFARDSRLAKILLRAGKARLDCCESAHSFEWQARIEESVEGSDLYEASLAHNRLFATQAPQRVLVFFAEHITRQ